MKDVGQTGSFRMRVLALVLLMIVPALALILVGNWKRRAMAREHGRERVSALAAVASAKAGYYVREGRQLLATMTQFTHLTDLRDERASQVGLDNLRLISPDFDEFGLIETNGAVFCRTTGSTNAIATDLFARVVASKDLVVRAVARSGTNITLQFGFPVVRTGAVTRVMFASLNEGLIGATLTELALPDAAVATVFDREGMVLARTPDLGGWIGKSVRGERIFEESMSKRGTVVDAPGLDGVTRIFGISAVEDRKEPALFVTVGIEREEIFAAANEEFLASCVSVLAFAGLLLLAARWFADRAFLQPMGAILDAAEKLTAGDLKARTGLNGEGSELNSLAKSFDLMAESLERRQAELERASQEIRTQNEALERRVEERTRELQLLNSELEAFTYSVSHDLRAPLRHMDGFAHILLADPSLQGNEKAQRHLTTITKSAKQMGALIDSLLTFSRMGRHELTKMKVAPAELLHEAVGEAMSQEKGRQIEWKIGNLPAVEADPTLLRLVWANLVSNALKYSRGRSPAVIEINGEQRDGEIIFNVRDNGAGFDQTYADKLFGVFQRLHRADEFEGTGIGLANVKRIVTRHGGRVWAEGKRDEGATFSFSLPARGS